MKNLNLRLPFLISFSLFYFLSAAHGYAQKKVVDSFLVDSLKQELNQTSNPDSLFKLQAELVIQLAIEEHDPQMILKRADALLADPLAHKQPYYQALLYNIKAKITFVFYRDLDKSEQYSMEAIKKLSKILDDKKAANLYILINSNIATIKGDRGLTEQQQKIYFDLLPLAKRMGNKKTLANIYRNIAIAFVNRGSQENYYKAIDYIHLSNHTFNTADPTIEHYAQNDMIISLIYANLSQVDSLEKYLHIFDNKLQKLSSNSAFTSTYYYLEGILHALKGNEQKALTSYEKGLKVIQKIPEPFTYKNILMGKFNSFIKLKRWHEAEVILQQLDQERNTAGGDIYALKFYELSAELQKNKGNYKLASQFLEQYIAKQDSIKSYEITNKLHMLEQQYDLSQKQNELELLRIENDNSKILLEKNQLISYVLIGLILCIIIVVIIYIRYREHTKTIQHNKIKLLTFEIESVKQNNLIHHMTLMKNIEEKERTRIALDLHDGLAGLLSGLKIAIQDLKNQFKMEGLDEKIDELSVNINDTNDELKRIVYNLSPQLVERYGIIEGMRLYCKRMESASVSIQFQAIDFNIKIVQEQEVIIFRIIQELINNAIKHASASEILVQLQCFEQQCHITVEDNGVGFDFNHEISGDSFGLKSLETRVKSIYGKLSYESDPEHGTSVYIECYPQLEI